MKAFLICVCLLYTFYSTYSYGEAKISPTFDQTHVELHEKMSKIHQQAADCLKSGKSPQECRKAFHASCKEAGSDPWCGEKSWKAWLHK